MSIRIAYSTDSHTAAKAKENAAKRAVRIEFVQSRNVALGIQRQQTEQRLAELRQQIGHVQRAIETDSISDPERVLTTLESWADRERKLVADIARLDQKMARP